VTVIAEAIGCAASMAGVMSCGRNVLSGFGDACAPCGSLRLMCFGIRPVWFFAQHVTC
jgi:hypothetical protein